MILHLFQPFPACSIIVSRSAATDQFAQLVLEPGDVELQVGALHLAAAVAGQARQDPGRQVDADVVRPVQQRQERRPHALALVLRILPEHATVALVLADEGIL